MRSFRLNIKGRVNNFPSFTSQPLMPVFEAIVNSFHAILERKKTDKNFHGKILIEIQRAICSDELPPIENVLITDNGVGFNDNNLNSFFEADSNYKSEYGCKGVGRFSWLRAFERVEVESNYCDKNNYYTRNFAFLLNKNEYADEEIIPRVSNLTENVTKVKLISYKKTFLKNAPKRLDIIANKIISHCLMYFMGNDCPEVFLKDDFDSLNLVNKFHEKVQLGIKESYKIKNSDFILQHAKVAGSFQTGHLLYLCANDRLVSTRELVKEISDLNMPLGDKEYYYVGILTSLYLDENVDSSRLTFVSIPEVAQENMFEVISMSNIIEAAASIISNYLKTDIEPLRKNKIALIQDFMRSTEGIGYRYLLKHCPEKVGAIQPGLSKEKLDLELYRIKKEFDGETKSSLDNILNLENIDPITYRKVFELNMDRVTDSSSSHLANYIAHRKTILDLFENSLNIKEDGKYLKESYIHDVIFPRGTTLEELPIEKHNLWLIDERLSYYFYAASDIPFNNDRGERRPDILFFDKPIALVDEKSDGTPYDTVVIFELKRPMRPDLEKGENPVAQVMDYVIKIQNKQLTDKNGRIIKVDDHTQYYIYIVCDVDNDMDSLLRLHYGFRRTPDGLGYFNLESNIHKEILSFDKILNDSKKRNRILFDKLNLV